MTGTLERPIHETLVTVGRAMREPLPVTLSPELIGLLSEQLYRSPSKAIEELVINGYDADATEARIFAGSPLHDTHFIAVFDDGLGMTYEGISDLWKVGRRKPRSDLPRHSQRKQIGKFGIGKLATYAIANRVTYISKSGGHYLGVTLDYRDFKSNPDSTTTAVNLDVHNLDNIDAMLSDDLFRSAVDRLGVETATLTGSVSWTIVILEDLKSKARTIPLGRLRWILMTAMPLSAEFRMYLNGDQVESSKKTYEKIVSFDLTDLPPRRLEALKKKTDEEWRVINGRLVAPSFPLGVSGDVIVTRRSLLGKSADLGRSEGFFVYVRGRLVNEEDARFGLHELSHATLNRFHARIHADDLDSVITANRESMEDVKLYRDAQALLNEVFNEARAQYSEYNRTKDGEEIGKREDRRNWVPERLVEYPTADALTSYTTDAEGSDADDSWMYLNVGPDTNVRELTSELYSIAGRKSVYTYRYAAFGSAGRLVEFEPSRALFTINQDHDLVREYGSDPSAVRLLEDLVTSEALLEVYLREAGLRPHAIGEVLERRDLLFRGLSNSRMFSLPGLKQYIIDSSSSSTELEVAVVAGARALGFVAKHIGGSGQPDGLARFRDFPDGEQRIVLEAKSSRYVPRSKDIDFSSIVTHMEQHNATGCLLISPGYQGDINANTAKAARRDRVSCWTIEQFAEVVGSAEARHISARRMLKIIKTKFAPQDVTAAVDHLLADPSWDTPDLYLAIVRALRGMDGRRRDAQRDVTMVASEVSSMDGFEQVQRKDVRRAIADLASLSRGGLLLRETDDVVLNVGYDELERRLGTITGEVGRPRRLGMFAERLLDE